MTTPDYEAIGKQFFAAMESLQSSSAQQMTREDLKGMCPEEVLAAEAQGLLKDIMADGDYGRTNPMSSYANRPLGTKAAGKSRARGSMTNEQLQALAKLPTNTQED